MQPLHIRFLLLAKLQGMLLKIKLLLLDSLLPLFPSFRFNSGKSSAMPPAMRSHEALASLR